MRLSTFQTTKSVTESLFTMTRNVGEQAEISHQSQASSFGNGPKSRRRFARRKSRRQFPLSTCTHFALQQGHATGGLLNFDACEAGTPVANKLLRRISSSDICCPSESNKRNLNLKLLTFWRGRRLQSRRFPSQIPSRSRAALFPPGRAWEARFLGTRIYGAPSIISTSWSWRFPRRKTS